MPFQELNISGVSKRLVEWVNEVAAMTKPGRIEWCDGSREEYDSLVRGMLAKGALMELNREKYPGCYLYRSDPNDVARTEDRTFICTPDRDEAGPTNNWMDDKEAKQKLWRIFDGCMKGRTMYVVPYIMGPAGSEYSQVGIEITDSPYVVISLKIMTRMGKAALDRLDGSDKFVRGLHSGGTLDPDNKYICHFPRERLIVSINSNYGGNALLNKKCHSLRIASVSGRDEGWLAEHMVIVELTDPDGNRTCVTGAFPSASGKTNLAMLRPPENLKDWKVGTVGDDISWMRLAEDGRFHAINPEYGFFGVAPGTSMKSNPSCMETVRKDTIFTNVALTEENTPWWEGMTDKPPSGLTDWQGRVWDPSKGPAAHPNSRFTSPISQFQYLSTRWEDPKGVPISAMIFGGRRAKTVPLVYESFNWEHGVLIGAMMKVETTAAFTGKVGVVRSDPMAMRPFCGYNMADYFDHWLGFAKRSKNLPRIYQVNWFRKGKDGRFLWPGYGENLRVLKWITERCNEKVTAVETPIGYVPALDSLDMTGLDIPKRVMEELLHVDKKEWTEEVNASEEFFKGFGERFPKRLWDEFYRLKERIEGW